jgi:hypothetical protein
LVALTSVLSVNRSALVVPSGAVNAAVEPVVTVIFVGDQVVKKFSLCNAKFVAAGSTKSAGHPAVPPLVK